MNQKVYCVSDKQFYRKVKTGIEIRINDNARQRGDLFECPVCLHKVISDLGVPY